MADFGSITEEQRRFFSSGETLPIRARLDALAGLEASLRSNEALLFDALAKDLGKSAYEAYETELGLVLSELRYVRKHLARWAAPRRVGTPLVHFPSSSRILREPYGLTLILSPWNYPVLLTLDPLIGALAGGNCAVVKPSAYSPATSAALAKILKEAFGEDYVCVVEGGRRENQALLEEAFDYIFFTGSVAVGKTVMEAASKHLTPVTLELGGKSPCIVCRDADPTLAARRIIWGKTLNAGQTCVAPDYLLVQRGMKDVLLSKLKDAICGFYGEDPLESRDLPKIINSRHFDRLSGYLSCGTIAAGGQTDAARLRISPTLLVDVKPDDPVMQEEVFGPILPVVEFGEIEEAIAFVRERPKPLALYLFTNSRRTKDAVLSRISFGGGCVNDTIVHLATSSMPFGGVGASGMGGYHGKWSFETFTHEKSVLRKSRFIDIPLRYPPYPEGTGLLRRVMR